MSEGANSFTSPFESGEWERWSNLERFNWLRAYRDGIKAKRKEIELGFKLDKKKLKRLDAAVDLLKAKVTEEMNITEQALKYSEAMVELGMDALLASEHNIPMSFPAFTTPKRIDNKGN